MRPLVIACALFLLLTACESRQEPKAPASQPQQAAQNAIGVLQKLVNDQNYKSLGFDSVDEAKQAQLAQPMDVYNIQLDQLKNYQPTSDPNTLLAKSSETVYPVTVNGQVKSSITIVRQENGYSPSSFGNAPIAREVSRYRQGNDDFIIRVPALNFYFVGRRVENRLMLVPIVSDPRVKLQAGEPLPADVVLQQLVPLAQAYNGLPM